MEPNARKIKVLHLIESGGMYGAENVILNLSVEMQKSEIYEPIVGCIIQNSREVPTLCDIASKRGIQTELFKIKNSRLPVDYIRFIRKLKAIGTDIIHSHGYKPSVFAYVAGKIIRTSVTATCHLWYVDEQAPLKMRMMIRLERAIYRRFPMVFAVSPAIRELLLAAGVSSNRTHVVNNGIPLRVSPARDDTEKQRVASQFGLEAGDICVVNTGRLTHQKSQRTIIDAARLLINRGRYFKFVIAGEGELRDELERHIVEEGLEDAVQLVGFTDQISDLLSIATVFVLPSRDEGMPISLLEAVAHRVPVVTTNVGAIESLIKDKISGLLIRSGRPADLAAAIEEIVDHQEQSKSLTERAYELLVSGYSSAAMFKEYDHYYQLIVRGGSDS